MNWYLLPDAIAKTLMIILILKWWYNDSWPWD